MTIALEGVRVLDLSRLLPGPYASLLLAELGADVVKVEDPAGGDPARAIPPLVNGESALFMALNRGKRSLVLDLKSTAGRETFLRLAARADVVLESFRPGTVERLGIDYQVVRARNPRAVYCSLSGYGRSGPLRDRAGHDVNYLALSGVLGLTGPASGPPAIPGVQIADLAGSMFAAVSILAALRARDQSGVGVYLDLSLFDASLAWLVIPLVQWSATGRAPLRSQQMLTGGFPCYNIYQTADGSFMSLGALEPVFWARFCQAVHRPDLVPRQFDPSAIAEVRSIFTARSREEWSDHLEGADCCCEPVLALDAALDRPQARHRAVWVSTGGPVPELHSPLRQVGRAEALPPPPGLGEHTAAVLAEGGLAPAEIDAILEDNRSAL